MVYLVMETTKQFKFEKQVTKGIYFLDVKPEQVIMIQIMRNMKTARIRSFKQYLKYVETDRIQRVSISIKEISTLLGIAMWNADFLAVKWMHEIGGNVVQTADLNTYYVPGVYEITA